MTTQSEIVRTIFILRHFILVFVIPDSKISRFLGVQITSFPDSRLSARDHQCILRVGSAVALDHEVDKIQGSEAIP